MRYDKHHRQDKLTIEQAVQCLEAELGQSTVLMATDFSNPSHVWLHRQLSANWGVELSNKTYVASAGPHC